MSPLVLDSYISVNNCFSFFFQASDATEPHLVIILLILIIIQEMNGTDPVWGFVVPGVVHHVVHQALQGTAAGKVIRPWDSFLKYAIRRQVSY